MHRCHLRYDFIIDELPPSCQVIGMSTIAYPPLLAAPTAPRALPLFRLSDGRPGLKSAARRLLWDAECAATLVECADRCTNAEIADLIAARTGKQFKAKT